MKTSKYRESIKSAGFTFIFIFAASLAMAQTFRVGDKVEGFWVYKWMPASVIEVKAGSYKLSYDDYDKSSDEWVGKDKIRLREKPSLGS